MFKKRGIPQEYTGFWARNKLWIAVATLMGTIVGAGILGIPYVVAKTGFLYGFILMAVIGIIFVFLNLFAGEVVLRTKEQHQLTGYAGKYLGKTGKRLMTLTMGFAIYGALTAYLIGEGATLHQIFGMGTPLFFTLIFFVIAAVIVYLGIKAAGKTELALICLLLAVVLLTGIVSFDRINLTHLTTRDFGMLFFPYGVILFAFVGSPAIPELQEVLGRDKKLMKKAIMIGSIIPIILYMLFTFVIMGLVGLDQFELLKPNERIATIALSLYSTPLLGMLANMFAVLAMFTSFLSLSIALIGIYEYDYGIPRKTAFAAAFIVPLLAAGFNLATFIAVLGVTGAVAGGIDGILITLMYWKAKTAGDRKPEYSLPKLKFVGILIILMFALGILYQVWRNLGA
ncbi:amino acid permease [Candidatus Woesearchaeota archaeon]|nr:amino acid permease [Candidatus Woesearchaeota archaeon]